MKATYLHNALSFMHSPMLEEPSSHLNPELSNLDMSACVAGKPFTQQKNQQQVWLNDARHRANTPGASSSAILPEEGWISDIFQTRWSHSDHPSVIQACAHVQRNSSSCTAVQEICLGLIQTMTLILKGSMT